MSLTCMALAGHTGVGDNYHNRPRTIANGSNGAQKDENSIKCVDRPIHSMVEGSVVY